MKYEVCAIENLSGNPFEEEFAEFVLNIAKNTFSFSVTNKN